MVDQEVVDLTAELVRIDSVNSDLVAGARGESAIADFIFQWFSARGFEVHRLEKHVWPRNLRYEGWPGRDDDRRRACQEAGH